MKLKDVVGLVKEVLSEEKKVEVWDSEKGVGIVVDGEKYVVNVSKVRKPKVEEKVEE